MEGILSLQEKSDHMRDVETSSLETNATTQVLQRQDVSKDQRWNVPWKLSHRLGVGRFGIHHQGLRTRDGFPSEGNGCGRFALTHLTHPCLLQLD
eukprot:scaffold177_cov334-Pavlova_lutheri.AAC.44